mgnify:CR=1 FL=1
MPAVLHPWKAPQFDQGCLLLRRACTLSALPSAASCWPHLRSAGHPSCTNLVLRQVSPTPILMWQQVRDTGELGHMLPSHPPLHRWKAHHPTIVRMLATGTVCPAAAAPMHCCTARFADSGSNPCATRRICMASSREGATTTACTVPALPAVLRVVCAHSSSARWMARLMTGSR